MTDPVKPHVPVDRPGPVDPASPAANRTTVRPPRVHAGTVTEFDPDVALGVVRGADGSTYRFHAAEITDGTRMIEVGADVVFEHLPRFGEIQAGRITDFER